MGDATADEHAPISLVSIVGSTRSGSTLLDRMLGECDGVFSTGEVRFLWERGLLERRSCGCGELIVACPVWTEVIRRAFGSIEHPDPDPREVVAWQQSMFRQRHTYRLIRAVDRYSAVATDSPIRRYTETLERLYRAIHEVTGARIIVNSSKLASDAAVSTAMPSIDPYLVHLIRDPRAVAASWKAVKPDPDQVDGTMPRHSVPTSTVNWLKLNLSAEMLMRRLPADHRLTLRYEDMVDDPAAHVARVARMVGFEPPSPQHGASDVVALGANHTISGNPDRFATGAVRVAGDVSRRPGLSTPEHLVATLLSLPLLARYHYPLGRSSSGAP